MDIRNGIRSANSRVESLLNQLGLEQKRSPASSVASAVVYIGAGVAIGTALGMAFAPKRGKELRREVKHRFDEIKDRSVEKYDQLVHHAEGAVEDAASAVAKSRDGIQRTIA